MKVSAMTDLYLSLSRQIQDRLGNFAPRFLIVLGSGLGSLADDVEDKIIIPYSEIQGFPVSTVSGHRGCLIAGKINGRNVICMQGRIHLYEGYQPSAIAEVIKAFKQLGISEMIVTNAAGSLMPSLPPGSLMLINDHINFSGRNPLIGPNDDSFGPRFPDMSNAYDREFRNLAHRLAKDAGIKLHDGTYLMVSGPNFETAAEIRAFQVLGANAVGMSTVPEVLAAVYCGIKVLGFSVITNYGTGLQTTPLSHQETLDNAAAAARNLTSLVKSFIKEA